MVDMMTKRGTFALKNFSIPTDDFLDVVYEFEFGYRTRGMITRFEWNKSTSPFSSEILTEHGLCMSFNHAFANEMFNEEKTSADFHYKIFRYYNHETIFTEFIPRHAQFWDNVFEIYVRNKLEYFQKIVNFDYYGYSVWIQDPYEFPSGFSQKIVAQSEKLIDVKIEPEMISIDESLYDDDPIEYVKVI